MSTVSGCIDCSSCSCEVFVEQPCEPCEESCTQCNKPCKCDECCVEECCERPPSACNGCSGPIEIITTVEIVETCGMYDQMIVNDEPQLIETIKSTYQISESELAKQKQEIEAFQKEIQSNRKGLCGNGGLFGIRGDEEQPAMTNASQEVSSSRFNNSDQTKGGGIIANLVNYNNNRPIKQCQIVSGWACRKFGRYPHPTSCQKVTKY